MVFRVVLVAGMRSGLTYNILYSRSLRSVLRGYGIFRLLERFKTRLVGACYQDPQTSSETYQKTDVLCRWRRFGA